MRIKVARWLMLFLILWCAIYISHLLDIAGLTFTPDQHEAVFLGILLSLTFLIYPLKRWGIAGKLVDMLLIAMSLVPTGFVVFMYDEYVIHGASRVVAIDMVLWIMIAISLIEALRRVLGIILPIVTLLFILYPVFSNYLPGILMGRGYSLARITTAFYLPDDGIFSLPLDIASTVIVAFLIFGQLLISSGAGETIMCTALSIVGRVRGGGAKASVISSAIFGTLNSSSAANVATTGTFTIPMMKRSGYRPVFAGGVEACASNGGHLSPPVMGTIAFVMAEMLAMPYFQLAIVAFIPAFLYYVCMFSQIDFEAARHGLKGLSASEIPSLTNTIKEGWFHAIPVMVLVYLLFFAHMMPELAALWSALSIIVVTAFNKKTRLGPKKLLDAIWETRRGIMIVGLTTAMAGIIIASLSLTSVALVISTEMVKFAGGSLFLLLVLAAITCFIFGMGMPSIPCYIFVSIMVAPSLVEMGIPLIASHLFVLYLALASFITPPVCMTSYVAAALAGTSPLKTGYWATRIGIGIFIVPFAWIYNPALLLMGSPMDIAAAFIFCLLGVVAIAAGLEGYLLRHMVWWQRILIFCAGFMLFSSTVPVRLSGLGLMLVLFGLQFVIIKGVLFGRIKDTLNYVKR